MGRAQVMQAEAAGIRSDGLYESDSAETYESYQVRRSL